MKTILLLVALVVVTACGKGGGGGASGSKLEPVRINCSSAINRDSLIEIAVSAQKARTECNLSEDQAVRYVTTADILATNVDHTYTSQR